MQEGLSDHFEYVTWDGSKWNAFLEQVKPHPVLPNTTCDPDFIHKRVVPPATDAWSASHTDNEIKYISDIGEQWKAKLHASTSPANIQFEFRHTKADESGGHQDMMLKFISWDGSSWEVRVQPLPHVPVPQTTRFILNRL